MRRLEQYFLSGVQKIIEYVGKCTSSDGYVLMFHEVNDLTSGDSNFKVSVNSFRKLMNRLKNSEKYEFITSKDLLNINSKIADRRSIVVTFDDAFEDVYLNAYPILADLGIPFTVFVSSEYVNRTGYLSVEEISELAKDPLCSIGGHLSNHVWARELSESDLEKSIDENFSLLSKIGNRKINYLAFPYGSVAAVSNRNIKTAYKKSNLVFMTFSCPFSYERIYRTHTVPRVNMNERSIGEFR